jgi:exopolyphosphatase/guanosine-5'-triphosphate,3'-diphosphate pyrophosphatase
MGLFHLNGQRRFKKAVMAFKLIAEVFNVVELRACATSAMREAKNGLEIQQNDLKRNRRCD